MDLMGYSWRFDHGIIEKWDFPLEDHPKHIGTVRNFTIFRQFLKG
jgi:hypothetical protein